ncbi:MAG: hypothetical protein IJL26_00345 [Clostridia bacterium]|nr:hypothetical protein [Clostridia bacterium]
MNETRKKIPFSKADLAALLIFCGLAALLLTGAKYATVGGDECYYYATAKRFLDGDRMFVDEWHLTQTSILFQLLPYLAAAKLAGGTEGILLHMRYAFIAVNLLIFICEYLKLRTVSRGTALAAAALLCADVYAGIFALNYYNLVIHFAVFLGLLLFRQNGADGKRGVLAGVLLSCAVLLYPFLALTYFFYGFLVLLCVLVRRKRRRSLERYAFVLNGKTFLSLTVGVALSAAVFLVFLLCTSGLGPLLENVPALFGDSEHQMTLLGNPQNLQKPKILCDAVGLDTVVGMPLLAGLAAVCKRFFDKKGAKAAILFCAQLLFLHGTFRISQHCTSFTVPMFALICYLLCENKDRRVFAFWWLSVLVSIPMDYASNVTIFFGGRIAWVPAVFFLFTLIGELRGERKQPRRFAPLQLAAAVLSVGMLFFAGRNITYITNTGAFMNAEDPTAFCVLEKGPLKGVAVSNLFARQYRDVLSDTDALGSDEGCVYVDAMCPYLYLAVERPVGAYTSFFVEADNLTRQAQYWEKHPGKRPAFVYIPYGQCFPSDRRADDATPASVINKSLMYFRQNGECVISKGAAGYLIEIKRWK